MIPQIVLICIGFLGLGVEMARHGDEKKGKENFFTSLISAAILHSILYWGGFYDVLLK